MFKLILKNSFLKFFSVQCIQITNRFWADAVCAELSHTDVIKNVLGISEEDAVHSLRRNSASLQKLSPTQLHQRLDVLQATGVVDVKETYCLQLAKHHQLTLKNRILSMQECGFIKEKITSSNIKRFLHLSKFRIKSLKEMNLIHRKTDVYYSLLEHADLLDLHGSVSDNNDLLTLKIKTLKLLLKKELGMSDEEFYRNSCCEKRLKNRSIRLIRKNIEIAKNIGFSSEKICHNPYILLVDPDNTTKVIEEIRELGGIDIRLCMQLYPKILPSSYEKLKEILDCLKEFGFSEETIQKSLTIFTLSAKSIRNRLESLEKDDFFNISKQLPRALQMVFHYNKVKPRMDLLKQINVVNPSVSTISSSDNAFDRYYKFGPRRITGYDIIGYVTVKLGCDRLKLRRKLRGSHFWKNVPLVEIDKNIKFLKDNGLSNEDIFSNVHVLFYDGSKLLEEFNSLNSRTGLECCKDEAGQIRKAFILPLIVYYIERSHNFSRHICRYADVDQTYTDITIPQYT